MLLKIVTSSLFSSASCEADVFSFFSLPDGFMSKFKVIGTSSVSIAIIKEITAIFFIVKPLFLDFEVK